MQYNEQYYLQRGLEHKHFIEALIWLDYFEPRGKILDIGCGHGHRVFTLCLNESDAYGIDIEPAIFTSPYLKEDHVYNKLMKDRLYAGSIINTPYQNKEFDLVITYDVLEHLTFEELEMALKELKRITNKHVLFSIPFIGDPNLERDKTHKIFRTKEWWSAEISRFFNLKPVPEHFLFKHQLLLGESK